MLFNINNIKFLYASKLYLFNIILYLILYYINLFQDLHFKNKHLSKKNVLFSIKHYYFQLIRTHYYLYHFYNIIIFLYQL